MFHILIVDEEEHLLWALENNLLPEREDTVILTAHTGEHGMELLRDHAIDVLICDIKMPGKVDGFQLILRAKEVAPDARVVIMTAFGSNRIQNLAESIGITHYIEKPFSVSDLRNVVLELIDAKEGFQGVLSDLELTDIIQMLCLAKRTTMLHLKHREHRGKIVFTRGEVAHAEFDEQTGPDAIYAMLALKQGDIFMQSDFSNDKQTVDLGWQDLLLEGVRLADEAGQPPGKSLDEPISDVDFGPPQLAASDIESPSMGMFSNEELREMESSGLMIQSSEGSLESTDHTSAGFYSNVTTSLSPITSDVSDMSKFSGVRPMRPSDDSSVSGLLSISPPGTPVDTFSDHTPFKREVTQPTAIAKEASSPHWQERSHGIVEESSPTIPARPNASSSPSPSLSVRNVLAELVDEPMKIYSTGIFSADDGIALEFAHHPHLVGFDQDILSAFFLEVISSAQQIVRTLDSNGQCAELQMVLSEHIVLINHLVGTPYMHIAVFDHDVRLGIAIVTVRRYTKMLSSCF